MARFAPPGCCAPHGMPSGRVCCAESCAWAACVAPLMAALSCGGKLHRLTCLAHCCDSQIYGALAKHPPESQPPRRTDTTFNPLRIQLQRHLLNCAGVQVQHLLPGPAEPHGGAALLLRERPQRQPGHHDPALQRRPAVRGHSLQVPTHSDTPAEQLLCCSQNVVMLHRTQIPSRHADSQLSCVMTPFASDATREASSTAALMTEHHSMRR